MIVAVLLAAGGGWLLRGGVRPASAPATGGTYTLSGVVSQVIDGDTVVLRAQGRARHVRLASIDAPETGGRDRQGQPFGQASRRALDALVTGRSLTARCYERDSYDRDVCDLPLADGQTANRRQVQAGMAWANRQNHGKYLRDTAIADLESEARRARSDLWAQAPAVAPWEWRQRCWNQGRC